MELRLFTEPQLGASYDDLLAVARAAERLDFGAFFRSDHYLAFHSGIPPRPGLTDAWTTLAALARDTSTIRLGTLMSAATFRLPGPLAVSGHAGRPDERRQSRAGYRRRLARGRTPGVRDSLPAHRGTPGAARRAVRDPHRALADPPRRTFLLPRAPLPARRQSRTAAAGAAAAPADHRRRAGRHPHTGVWRRGSPTSTTSRSLRWTKPAASSNECGKRAWSPTGTRWQSTCQWR